MVNVDLKALTSSSNIYKRVLNLDTMADAIITFKIMPESPETSLDDMKAKVIPLIEKFGGEVIPVAFGIKALQLIFVMDENLGGTDQLEEDITKLKEVLSVDLIDIRRAIG